MSYRKLFLIAILSVLGYGFWVSPDFKMIAAGVAIFLAGMLSLEEGFRAFTGGMLEQMLQRTTDKMWKSLTFGIISTTIMQSSSLVSVITISFLSAGLIGLGAGIGIIFGANIGTTTGAWLIAGFGLKVDIAAYAMPMLVFGVILVFQSAKSLKGIGSILIGLGFLFLGIHYMKDGFDAFRDTLDLAAYAMTGFWGLIVFTLFGMAATVIMQSSHATLVLIITALGAGQITYENALALAIGANIGTTITAIIGAMSANEQGKRLAAAHLIFNVVTGIIAITFIGQFRDAVDFTSAAVGIADNDYTLKLAVFHTIFNLVGVMVMLPFTDQLQKFLVATFKRPEIATSKPRYLNNASAEFPDAAVSALRQECGHLYENGRDLIMRSLLLKPADLQPDATLSAISQRKSPGEDFDFDTLYQQQIKDLYSAIIEFISKAQVSWSQNQSGTLSWLREASRSLVEAIKDVKHLRKNFTIYAHSNNAHIRQEYMAIREQIASVLQEMEEIRSNEDDDLGILALDQLRVQIDEADDHLNQQIDTLIREGKISPQMGTSLMNDTSYAHDIATKLIAVGSSLFRAPDPGITSVEYALSLDDDERHALSEKPEKNRDQ
ncbi:MAG: Na/Pi symporter [Gammaproteobacteria bacterium]|nr:Na/Pi symporter [Gammaproteobacteria bacterium]